MATNAIPSCWICGKPVLLEDCKIDRDALSMKTATSTRFRILTVPCVY